MLTEKDDILYGLCKNCRFKLPLCEKTCEYCGRPLVSEIGNCLDCRQLYNEDSPEQRPDYDKLSVLFPYTGKYRKLLWTFKYEKNTPVALFLAEKIIEVLKKENLDKPVLVPVPPRPGKIKKTGWDQIKYLSAKLADVSPFPVLPCLVRKAKDTQKNLNRDDRRKNLKGKIIYKYKFSAPLTCVVFDDVITTGSTIDACAHALKKAGAGYVLGVSIFYD